jgi:hypothetical protein
MSGYPRRSSARSPPPERPGLHASDGWHYGPVRPLIRRISRPGRRPAPVADCDGLVWGQAPDRRFCAPQSRLRQHDGPHADRPVLCARGSAGQASSSRQKRTFTGVSLADCRGDGSHAQAASAGTPEATASRRSARPAAEAMFAYGRTAVAGMLSARGRRPGKRRRGGPAAGESAVGYARVAAAAGEPAGPVARSTGGTTDTQGPLKVPGVQHARIRRKVRDAGGLVIKDLAWLVITTGVR